MKHFLGSIKLFGRHRILWPYLWKPILIAFTLYVTITVAAALAVGGALGAQLQSSVMQPLGSAAGAALIVVTAVFFGWTIAGWAFNHRFFLALGRPWEESRRN